MSTGVYESILQGLNEAISTEKGHLRAKRCRMTVQPPEEFDAEEIRTIRLSANMTQKIFANFLGVSPKTVESWEAGRYKRMAPARRAHGAFASGPHVGAKIRVDLTIKIKVSKFGHLKNKNARALI